jgi:acyl carrier protein
MTSMDALLQQAIVKICGLDAERVRLDATFSEIGVDSLDAAEILVELEIGLGRELPVDVLRRLEEHSTLKEIASRLEAEFNQTSPAA